MAQARKKMRDKREAPNRYSRKGSKLYSAQYQDWKAAAKVGSSTAHQIEACRATHTALCKRLFS